MREDLSLFAENIGEPTMYSVERAPPVVTTVLRTINRLECTETMAIRSISPGYSQVVL
jgi:hypothetical protein